MITGLIFAFAAWQKATVSTEHSCCDPMAALAMDPKFAAAHLAPRPMRFAPTAGKDVSFGATDGVKATGFYVPAKAGTPAIIMVHEWWGLNDYIKREAETLAGKGYAVLAVNLYDGPPATTADEAGKKMAAVKQARAQAIVDGAISTLTGGGLGTKYAKLGTIGWCFGGGWSHRTAIAGGSAVKACVMYYGMPDTDEADLAKLKAPVLMVWATKDQWINKGVVDKFKTAMAIAHKPLTVLPYNEDHAFANPSNPKYGKTSSDSAMKATLAFFKKNL